MREYEGNRGIRENKYQKSTNEVTNKYTASEGWQDILVKKNSEVVIAAGDKLGNLIVKLKGEWDNMKVWININGINIKLG